MNARLADLPADQRDKLRQCGQPEWTSPMLATLTKQRFSDERWICERKLDGERCLAFITRGSVRLLSRNKKALNTQYPELCDALAAQPSDHFIVDGEVVAFKGNVTSFARLQKRMHVEDSDAARKTGVVVYFYLFDMLYLDGYDLTQLPLRTRKALLKHALQFEDPLRFELHRNQDGMAFFHEACAKGWEGIIAKRAGSTYQHMRSHDWLKFKCVNRQEFVVGGYTEPSGARIGFGALLLGYYEDGSLRFAGKVGTGFDDKTLRDLHTRLQRLEQKSVPFVDPGDLPTQNVHWVAPELVAQIGFEEWTRHDKLRQPRFQGLREDKAARDVVREEPKE